MVRQPELHQYAHSATLEPFHPLVHLPLWPQKSHDSIHYDCTCSILNQLIPWSFFKIQYTKLQYVLCPVVYFLVCTEWSKTTTYLYCVNQIYSFWNSLFVVDVYAALMAFAVYPITEIVTIIQIIYVNTGRTVHWNQWEIEKKLILVLNVL